MALRATTTRCLELLALARDHHAHNRWAEAEKLYCDAITASRGFSGETWACMGSLALERGHVADPDGVNLKTAILYCRRALEFEPDNPIATSNLAAALLETGEVSEAIKTMRRAIEIIPRSAEARSAYLFALNYSAEHDETAIAQETELWREWARTMVPNPYTAWNVGKQPDRPLKIGYVSADWHNHAVGTFMRPILAHHSESFQIVKYDLREIGCSDAELAARIRGDCIDILVDLVGHTRHGRPLLFAHRPAPVGIYYLALPGDAGTCDYYLTDSHLTPHHDPRALKLQSYWCYPANPAAPEVGPLPALRNGYVTFGSLNNFAKVGPAVLAAWRKILEAVPTARMIMLCPHGEARGRVKMAMGETFARVELVARQGLAEYFETWNRIDVALDAFPFCGGTTTCDALWMGVPVVTMAGDKPVHRSGSSILNNCGSLTGLPVYVDSDADGYVETAKVYASPNSLRRQRKCVRDEMLASPLMNAPAFVRDLEAQYRAAWRGWCGQ